MKKDRQASVASEVVDLRAPAGSAFGGKVLTPATGVQAVVEDLRAVRHTRLLVTALEVDVDEADDFGSAKLVDLPDTNMLLLGMELNLELTKGGVTNGLVAATDLLVGIGTAATASSDLSGGSEDNVLTGISLTASDASPALAFHSNDEATVTWPKKLADGASNSLYLNVGASITASDTLTVDGYIDLYWVDLGNTTS
jgi:hypothetical protein